MSEQAKALVARLRECRIGYDEAIMADDDVPIGAGCGLLREAEEMIAALSAPAQENPDSTVLVGEAVAFNYAMVHRFATENSVDYNALSKLIRKCVITTPPAPSAADKPHVHVGTIGHVSHDKSALTAAITRLQSTTPTADKGRAWKCNCCGTSFNATSVEWGKGFGRCAPACPNCKAVSQYTYPANLSGKIDKLEHMGFSCEGGPLSNCREWQEIRAALTAAAPQEFDRALETSRRQSAVELLLALGYVWRDTKWEAPQAPVGGDGMLPDNLASVSAEWYELCERAPYAHRIGISGELAEAIVATVCAAPPALTQPVDGGES